MKIIVAIAFDNITGELETAAFNLAKRLNAEIDLLSIVDKNLSYMPIASPMVAETWQEQCLINKANLEKMQKDHPDVVSHVISIIGDPKEDIINTAIENKASMILLGTHGRTGLNALLIGSTAEYVVRHSTIPVLTVPFKHKRH